MKNGKAYPMECGVWDGVSLLSGFGEVEFPAISENVFLERFVSGTQWRLP